MTAAELAATVDPEWFAALVAAMAPPVRYRRDGDHLVVTR